MNVTDKDYWKEFHKYDMPDKEDLRLINQKVDSLLILDRRFIQSDCVPFIKYENAFYKADLLEVVPTYFIKFGESCRTYTKCEIPEELENHPWMKKENFIFEL